MLDGFRESDVPQLLHRGFVLVASEPGLGQLAFGVEPAAHGGERGVRADADLAFEVVTPEVAQRGLAVLGREVLLGVDDGFGAPDGRDDHALAINSGHFASLAVGEAREIVVHGELVGIPSLHEAVGGPAADAVARGLHDVIGAGLQRQLGLGVHVVLAGLLGEVHLDAGVGGEGREHLGGEIGIAGPAHEVHFARGGERGLDVERTSEAHRAQGDGGLEQGAARNHRGAHRVLRGCKLFHSGTSSVFVRTSVPAFN